MEDQFVTWDQILTMSGVVVVLVLAAAGGLTRMLTTRMDKIADAVTALQQRDAKQEVDAERRYATHDDMDRMESRLREDGRAREERLRTELGEIKKEIRTMHSEIAARAAVAKAS